MNEQAARRALRDLGNALEALESSTAGFVRARRRLRDLENDGFGPGGSPEGSIGGGRHGDPTARAVLANERTRTIEENGEPVVDDEGRTVKAHAGWRTRDQFEAQRKRLETELRTLVEHAQNLAEECADVLRVADVEETTDNACCRLCDEARYPVDAHKCDELCRDREHRHADRRQQVYSRTAPRTPARVHACAPPRLAVAIDGTTELAVPSPRTDATYVIVERALAGTDRQYVVVPADHVPAGGRILARLTLPAFAPHVLETDLVAVPTVADVPRCSWHYEFAERYGVDAGSTLTLWHLEHPGARVPNTLVRDTHPLEFARYHATRAAS